jgi:ADP-ribose pyrophosphatase YjhB (NUDIX family)
MEQRMRIGVYGVAVHCDRLLLTQLSSRDEDVGRWTLPGGGMEFGESPHETLTREFYEETGLLPEIGSVLDVMSYLPRPGLHVIQMMFEVQAQGEPRVIEVDGSTADAAWVPTESVASMPTVPLVDRVLELRRW